MAEDECGKCLDLIHAEQRRGGARGIRQVAIGDGNPLELREQSRANLLDHEILGLARRGIVHVPGTVLPGRADDRPLEPPDCADRGERASSPEAPARRRSREPPSGEAERTVPAVEEDLQFGGPPKITVDPQGDRVGAPDDERERALEDAAADVDEDATTAIVQPAPELDTPGCGVDRARGLDTLAVRLLPGVDWPDRPRGGVELESWIHEEVGHIRPPGEAGRRRRGPPRADPLSRG